MSQNSQTNNSIGFTGLLTIVFIVLKLTNYINWSWWWILSPLWLPLLLIIGGGLIYFGYVILIKK